jgi:hypothetical protein
MLVCDSGWVVRCKFIDGKCVACSKGVICVRLTPRTAGEGPPDSSPHPKLGSGERGRSPGVRTLTVPRSETGEVTGIYLYQNRSAVFVSI